jgi:hypothetical protein
MMKSVVLRGIAVQSREDSRVAPVNQSPLRAVRWRRQYTHNQELSLSAQPDPGDVGQWRFRPRRRLLFRAVRSVRA